MIVGQRIRARLAALSPSQPDLSQAELARRVGMSQSGMVNLIAGRTRSTTYLHKIARELLTTPAYLTGETDDPDAGAPPPRTVPRSQVVTMQVHWPPEEAIAEMLEGYLLAFARLQGGELAHAIAKRLPKAIARLQGQRLTLETVEDEIQPEELEPQTTARRGRRQA